MQGEGTVISIQGGSARSLPVILSKCMRIYLKISVVGYDLLFLPLPLMRITKMKQK